MKNLFGIFLLGLLTLVSCKDAVEAGDALHLVPNTVTSVTAVRIDQLLEKADFENIRELEFFEDALKDVNDPTIEAILRNPYESGIDLEMPIYIANDLNAENIEDMGIMTVMTLKDADKFAALMESVPGETGTLSGITTKKIDRKTVIGWNDEAVIVAATTGYDDVASKLPTYFATTDENSVVNDKSLRDLLGKGADISSWATLDAFAKSPQVRMGAGMIGIDADALEGNVATSFMNFEKGQVSGFSYLDFKDALVKDFEMFVKDEVETDFSQYVPKENLLFVMTVGLNGRGLDEVLANNTQYRTLADMGLMEMGLTSAELLRALDGDLMVAGHMAPGMEEPTLSFATKINDEEVVAKLLNARDFGLTSTGNNTWSAPSYNNRGNAMVAMKDGMLFIADDATHFAKMIDGGYGRSERIDGEAEDWTEDNLVGLYVNLVPLLNLDEDSRPLGNVLSNFVMGVEREESEAHLNLKRDDVNSLQAILEAANDMYKADKNR